MALKILFFDYRESEHRYFEMNKFDNYEIKFFDFPLTPKTYKKLSEQDKKQANIISVFITSELTAEVINGFRNLRMVTTRSSGYNHIDIKSCANRNISVLNVPNYGASSVAQYTFGLILALVRNIKTASIDVKNGKFSSQNYFGRNLKNMTIGIIGTGTIGANTAKLANAFGMKILAYDNEPKNELRDKFKVEYSSLFNVLRNSDIITLHIPYNQSTYHIFSDYEFAQMKDNSYFINVSRGELVDNQALKKYLISGKLKGVALDNVACKIKDCKLTETECETSSVNCINKDKTLKELKKFDNVIITPHIAFDTQDSIDYILETTFKEINECINGGHLHRAV